MTSEIFCKVMVSDGILKSGSITKKCETEEKSNRYIKGGNYKKVLLGKGIFRENKVNRSCAFWKKPPRNYRK